MNKKTDKLGFWSIVLLAINSIIGSGIFLTPGNVVKIVGSQALVVYFIAAIFASILAITFASAAKYVTKSGAAYAYAKAAFGDKVGFYIGVLRYFSASVAWGVMAVGVIKSTLSIFGKDPNKYENVTLGFLILMLLITIINIFGQRVVKYIMNLATVGKLLALGLLILAGGYLVLTSNLTINFSQVDNIKVMGKSVGSTITVSSYVMAIVSAFYAFTGFEAVASGSEDMKNPAKNLKKAIPLAIFMIAIIYICVVAVALFLNPQALIQTKQVVAISAIFENNILKNIILIGALISMFGINIAASFSAPRVLEAMANEGQMPKWIAMRTRLAFPMRAFIVTVLLAVLIPMSFRYNMLNLITISAMVRFLGFIIVPLGVIKFYLGKSAQQVLPATRNFITDVLIPILSIVVTFILLVKYNWQSQFGVVVNGKLEINWFAVMGIIFGFVVLPAVLAFLMKFEKSKKGS